MIEVVFCNSTKESLTRAKHLNKQLEENAHSVVCIGNSLEIGDISCSIDGVGRRRVYEKIDNQFNYDKHEEQAFFNSQIKDMEKLVKAVSNGESIRIWKSNAPYSVCGFYFVCDLLRQTDCEISVITLPEYLELSYNVMEIYSGWHEISSEDFEQFLHLERKLSRTERYMYSNFWCDLKEENAPLRVLVNGRLISAQENFYDYIIMKNLDNDSIPMSNLIGRLISKYQFGVSDTWYAHRVVQMIKENKIQVVEDSNPSKLYSEILRATR